MRAQTKQNGSQFFVLKKAWEQRIKHSYTHHIAQHHRLRSQLPARHLYKRAQHHQVTIYWSSCVKRCVSRSHKEPFHGRAESLIKAINSSLFTIVIFSTLKKDTQKFLILIVFCILKNGSLIVYR